MYRGLVFLFCSIFVLSVFNGCKQEPTNPQLAFYHWTISNADDNISGQDEDNIRHFNAYQLYVKIMDIDWDDIYGVYPATAYYINNLSYPYNSHLSDSISYVPVVFITNRALEKTDSSDINTLAQKIVLKTEQLVKRKSRYTDEGIEYYIDSTVSYKEVQFDCDWTRSTQKRYFALLAQIKKLLPNKLITSTLRLHQYKYPEKTGVPPVDQVYLMCYNTGEVKKIDELNSIFDNNKAKAYFTGAKRYPVKMNFALPAFEWFVIFKNNKFYKIDNGIDKELFADTSFVKHTSGNLYSIQKDTVINNNFIRQGDVIKWEKITEPALIDAARLCSTAINSDTFKVVFYDINHINPNNYEAVQQAFNCFRR